MKKSFLLLPLIGAFIYVTMSSDSNGPGGNRTGSHGTSGVGCGGGCHGSSSTAGITISFELDSAGVPVNRYMPGMTYTLKMTGTNTTANNLPKYGMQLSMVAGSGSSSTQAGSFSGLPTGVSSHTSGGITILEHNQRLSPATGTGATNTTYEVSVTWTAPAAGTGMVSAYGVINAVNTSPASDDAGDKWNTANTSFTELPIPTSVENVTSANANIYPNPVTDVLNISGYSGMVQVYSADGRLITSIDNATSISTTNWAPGMYIVTIGSGNGTIVKQVIKN